MAVTGDRQDKAVPQVMWLRNSRFICNTLPAPGGVAANYSEVMGAGDRKNLLFEGGEKHNYG